MLEGALPESGPEVDEARHVAIGEVEALAASAVGWRRQLLARQRAGAVRVRTMHRVRERVGQRGLRELRQEFGLEQSAVEQQVAVGLHCIRRHIWSR